MLINEPIIQIYRDSIHGSGRLSAHDVLLRYLDKLAQGGVANAVCFHGFADELVTHWDALATATLGRNLKALASWGLDTTKLGGKRKGELVAAVVSQPSCTAGLLDAEGQWDINKGPSDLTTPAEALALGESLRDKAPTALVGDQAWFALDSHGDVRTKAGPGGIDDIFSGFPADEFAVKAVNWIRFRQAYFNNKPTVDNWGVERWDKGEAWMDRDWAKFNATCVKLGRQNLIRPLGITIQGYGWDDIPHVLVRVLIKYLIEQNQPVVIWCEPFPSKVVESALRFVNFLQTQGFVQRIMKDGRSLVRAFQVSYNTTHPATPLTVDGSAGQKTMTGAGCWVTA